MTTRNTHGENIPCYVYSSDGEDYLLSAWAVAENSHSASSSSPFYRRYGYREYPAGPLCNHGNIGGNYGGTYDLFEDRYRHSFTLTTVTTCNETANYVQ